MMTLIDDLRLAVREMLQSSRTAMTVMPVLVLGIALNVIALSVVDSMRLTRHSGKRTTQVRAIVRCEMRQVQAVVVSTLRRIGDVRREKRSTNKSVADRADALKCRVEVGFGIVASVDGDGPALSVRMAYPTATSRFGMPMSCNGNVA